MINVEMRSKHCAITLNEDNPNLLICGGTGSGKSFLAINLIRSIKQDFILINSKNERSEKFFLCSGKDGLDMENSRGRTDRITEQIGNIDDLKIKLIQEIESRKLMKDKKQLIPMLILMDGLESRFIDFSKVISSEYESKLDNLFLMGSKVGIYFIITMQLPLKRLPSGINELFTTQIQTKKIDSRFTANYSFSLAPITKLDMCETQNELTKNEEECLIRNVEMKLNNYDIVLNQNKSNLLIHGKTGTGKSVLINKLIESIKHDFILIESKDAKKGENFVIYPCKNGLDIGYLQNVKVTEYIGNIDNLEIRLMKEIKDRKLMENKEDLAPILVVIDELSLLMMDIYKDASILESKLDNLFILGSKVGIYVILTSQLSSQKLPSKINELFDTQIETSKIDSEFFANCSLYL